MIMIWFTIDTSVYTLYCDTRCSTCIPAGCRLQAVGDGTWFVCVFLLTCILFSVFWHDYPDSFVFSASCFFSLLCLKVPILPVPLVLMLVVCVHTRHDVLQFSLSPFSFSFPISTPFLPPSFPLLFVVRPDLFPLRCAIVNLFSTWVVQFGGARIHRFQFVFFWFAGASPSHVGSIHQKHVQWNGVGNEQRLFQGSIVPLIEDGDVAVVVFWGHGLFQ